MLLNKHWVSLKTAPVAILVNVSNTGYLHDWFKKDSLFWDLLTEILYICMETFIKVFFMLWFSLPYKLSRIRRNSVQVNCLSLNRYLLLKKWRHWAISVKKKISHNNYLKLYLILTHHKTKLFVFFLFSFCLKETGPFLFFTQRPKISSFMKLY